MRTPKGSKAGGRKTEVNKLRKKAMKNKMMKQTMLTLAGDDTKDDMRDLMNDSGNLSTISIIGSPAASKKAPAKSKKSPGRKKVTKSESSLSLKNLGAQLSRRTSRRKLKEEPIATNGVVNEDYEIGDRMEVVEVNGARDEVLAKHGNSLKVVKVCNGEHPASSNGHIENGTVEGEGVSRLQGVKNMLSSAVWGVPYAKVVEDGDHDEGNTSQISTKSQAQSGCTIS